MTGQVTQDPILSIPAAALARRAPEEWRAFLTAFKQYADAQRENLVRSSLDELQRSQGRAQNCSQLYTLLEDAVQAADRIAEKAGRK